MNQNKMAFSVIDFLFENKEAFTREELSSALKTKKFNLLDPILEDFTLDIFEFSPTIHSEIDCIYSDDSFSKCEEIYDINYKQKLSKTTLIFKKYVGYIYVYLRVRGKLHSRGYWSNYEQTRHIDQLRKVKMNNKYFYFMWYFKPERMEKIIDSLMIKSDEISSLKVKQGEYKSNPGERERIKNKIIPIIMNLLKQNPDKQWDEEQLKSELNINTHVERKALDEALMEIIENYQSEGFIKFESKDHRYYTYFSFMERIKNELKKSPGELFTKEELRKKLNIKSVEDDNNFRYALYHIFDISKGSCYIEGFRVQENDYSELRYYYVEP